MLNLLLIVGVYNPNELLTVMVKYFDLCEVILLTWVPVAAIALWLALTVLNLVRKKKKDTDFSKLSISGSVCNQFVSRRHSV